MIDVNRCKVEMFQESSHLMSVHHSLPSVLQEVPRPVEVEVKALPLVSAQLVQIFSSRG